MRWLAWLGRGSFLLVALGAALLGGADGPVLAADVTLKFDPAPKYGPVEGASYGAANVDTYLHVGKVAAEAQRAQGFQVSGSTRALRAGVWLKKLGMATDSLTVEIQPDAGDLPSGTPIANGTSNAIAATSVSSGYFTFLTFTFAVPPDLAGGTQYHLVLKRSGPPSVVGYYMWGADTNDPPGDANADGCPGVAGVDDDGDTVIDLGDPDVRRADYDGDTTELWGDNATVESTCGPPTPGGDDDPEDVALAANDDDEDGRADEPGYVDGAASVYDSDSGIWTAASPASDHAFGVNHVQVDVVVEGLTGGNELGAYEVAVQYQPAGVVTALGIHDGGFLGSTGRAVSCLAAKYGTDSVNLSCTTWGPPPPMGPTGAGVLATISFGPLTAGSVTPELVSHCQQQGPKTCVLRYDGTVIDSNPTLLDGAITIQSLGPATGDSDGDGCSDLEEAGDNIAQGGDRDWLNPWDFFDVPVPANQDPTPNGSHNWAIAIGDVLAVLFYAGAGEGGVPNGNGVDYDSDKNGDTVADGRDYDRSPAPPLSGPPDGAISIPDVLAALGQAGHSCAGP